MSRPTIHTQRFDPYRNYKFRVMWDGRYVAGVTRLSPLKRSTEVVRHREGHAASGPSPTRSKFEAITLERGVTHDAGFADWANTGFSFCAVTGSKPTLKDLRQDVIVEQFDEIGKRTHCWRLFRCWVSKIQALPDLDANASAVAFEVIKLENEGWERHEVTTDPAEPNA